jgi:hypothetical protein
VAGFQAWFMTPGGPLGPFGFALPANSRLSIRLNDWVPGEMGVSTLIRGDSDLVVERSMYWDSRAASQPCEMMGGHCASGLDP